MIIEMADKEQMQIELYEKLAGAESEIANGAEGVDFLAFAKEPRKEIRGKEQSC